MAGGIFFACTFFPAQKTWLIAGCKLVTSEFRSVLAK
jgi:hypothetical protein